MKSIDGRVEEKNSATILLHVYDGAGNRFYLYDARVGAVPARFEPSADQHIDFQELSRRICAQTDAEADGLLVIGEPTVEEADARMTVYNADGSEPEMCGNGARCAVRYLLEAAGERIVLQTGAGLVRGEILTRGRMFSIRIDIGAPRFAASELGFSPHDVAEVLDYPLSVGDTSYRITGISMGNPHVMIFVDDAAAFDLMRLGPMIEHDGHFANGVNLHVVEPLDARSLRVRHWERGAGATAACGTGAVASAIAATRRGLVEMPVRVVVPGGELIVDWDGADGTARLSGPVIRHPDATAVARYPRP